MPENQKPKTLDDLFTDKDIVARIKAHDEHMRAENQQHLLNQIIAPAIDEFYETLKAQLDHAFANAGGDTAKVREKLPEVRKALVEGLKKYFERALPSALDTIKDVKDVDEQFKTLARIYDRHVLGAQPGARLPQGLETIENYMTALEQEDKYKEATVGQIKEELWLQKGAHAVHSRAQVNRGKTIEYLMPIPTHRLGKQIRPEIEKTHEIEHEGTYATLSHEELLEAREGVKTNSWSNREKPGPKYYGLKVKEQQQQR